MYFSDLAPYHEEPLRRRGVERSSLDISEGKTQGHWLTYQFPWFVTNNTYDHVPDIQRNREYYRNADVRPPFTYASLIREVSPRYSFKFHFLRKFSQYILVVWWYLLLSNFPGNNRVPGSPADVERDLQLVPEHILLLQTQRCHVEGTVFAPNFEIPKSSAFIDFFLQQTVSVIYIILHTNTLLKDKKNRLFPPCFTDGQRNT